MNFPLPSSNLLPRGIFVEPRRYLLIGGITLVFQGEILVLIIVPMPTWGGLGKERKSGVSHALANKIINTQRCLVTEAGGIRFGAVSLCRMFSFTPRATRTTFNFLPLVLSTVA